MFKKMAPLDLNWLQETTLKTLLNGLGEARIVGGAVRNSLLNIAINDIDIATILKPDEVITYGKKAGFEAIPTGLEHGTVTLIKNQKSFEVTSLREDVSTDGRHAKIKFTTNWENDAKRRDFTINALYMDASGEIYDYINGLNDLTSRTIRFIGNAHKRIEEDYLRILRFFRFYTYYGESRPNREALLSCSALRHGLHKISSERIWGELKKILQAPNPLRAILWMRKAEILSLIIPQTEKWGIDLLPALINKEQEFNWDIAQSPLLRLQAIIPKDIKAVYALSEKLKLSNKEQQRLVAWANAPQLNDINELNKFLFLYGKDPLIDNLKLEIANGHDKLTLLNEVRKRTIPIFPVKGRDLITLDKTGPEIGRILKYLTNKWLEHNCSLTKQELLQFINSENQ